MKNNGRLPSVAQFVNEKKASKKINLNEGEGAGLEKFVKDLSDETFEKGGNGQNILEILEDAALYIDAYHVSHTGGPGEPGFYSDKVVDAFKALGKAIMEDEITNNHVDKHM